MERIGNILRIIANYVAQNINKEEMLMGIRKELDKLEKE